MQLKNIYIFAPPGYCSNYLRWAIDISDVDKFDTVIKNPINTSDTPQFGSFGTSHLHTRIPTHQSIQRHIPWQLRNKPTTPNIYLVDNSHNHQHIFTAMQHDPNSVFINIYTKNDGTDDPFVEINVWTKWAISMATALHLDPEAGLPDVDFMNCANEISVRNFLIKNSGFWWLENRPIDLSRLEKALERDFIWHFYRNKFHPHEVNSDTYLMDRQDYTNRIFEIDCMDIVSDKLPDLISNFLQTSGAIDKYDCSYLKNFHHNYVAAQQNLQWYESIRNWRVTGILDQYLTSHAAIEAQVVKEIFRQYKVKTISYQERRQWKDQSVWLSKMIKQFAGTIPDDVINGILPDFLYDTEIAETDIGKLIISKQWETMPLIELNDIHQNFLKRKL